MGELTEYERLISIRIMQKDAESIYSLLPKKHEYQFTGSKKVRTMYGSDLNLSL